MVKIKDILMYILYVILLFIFFMSIVILIDSYLNPNKVPGFFGWKPFVSTSNSMIDAINPGDLIIAKETKADKIKENDIIAFKYDDVYITHRVIKILKNENEYRFVTKGDANKTEDAGYVMEKDVEGLLIYNIPKVGNAILFIQTPLGMAICLIVPFLLLLYEKYQYDKEEKKLLKEKIQELEKTQILNIKSDKNVKKTKRKIKK